MLSRRHVTSATRRRLGELELFRSLLSFIRLDVAGAASMEALALGLKFMPLFSSSNVLSTQYFHEPKEL